MMQGWVAGAQEADPAAPRRPPLASRPPLPREPRHATAAPTGLLALLRKVGEPCRVPLGPAASGRSQAGTAALRPGTAFGASSSTSELKMTVWTPLDGRATRLHFDTSCGPAAL